MFERTKLVLKFFTNKYFIVFVNLILISLGSWLGFFGYQSLSLAAKEVLLCPNFPDDSNESFAKVYADISGSVNKPGVYQLDYGARLSNLVEMAGGLTRQADSSYIAQSLNLAQELRDADKFYIPSQGEKLAPDQTNNPVNHDLVSINLASSKDLQKLSGIGEKRAEEIMGSRPFSSLNELVSKSIISQTLFDEIKSQIEL
jgi:competence protein ComEA